MIRRDFFRSLIALPIVALVGHEDDRLKGRAKLRFRAPEGLKIDAGFNQAGEPDFRVSTDWDEERFVDVEWFYRVDEKESTN